VLPDPSISLVPLVSAPLIKPVPLRMLYIAVFASGMTTLAVELSASRLLGNVFGTSNLVWANIIGLILIYLTAGYFIGGRWADRSPRFITLYRIITWGAFTSGLVPLVARPVLSAAASAFAAFDAGVSIGSFVAVVILFSVPITLLGCVSPFALRLALADMRNAGKTAGRMYAISTLGSILGTFAPVLYLIPELGTTQTFLVFSLILLAIGLIGLATQSRWAALQLLWMPVVLIVWAAIALNTPLRPPPAGMTLLYDKDSAYNYIQVVEYPDRNNSKTRLLLLNEGQGIHSQWNSQQIYFGRTWDFFMAAPYFNPAPYNAANQLKRVCIIGLAAGTIAHQYTAVFGAVPIDGIEIDPQIVETGRRYFGMTEPNLNVIIQDGRLALHQSTQKYSVVGIDAYRVPYVPWNLTTLEFFQDVRAHLTADGVVVINVGRTVNADGQQDRRLIQAMTHTLAAVYPSIYTIDVPGSFNTILVATAQKTDAANLNANLVALPTNADLVLRTVLDSAVKNLQPTVQSDVLFTDDRAPVETIVDSMVINFLTGGGAQQFAK